MTPHMNAKKGEIAKTVLMPGDPYRAKYIAGKYLENAKLVNDVRGMLGYTGTYQGKEVTVMASGMGCPSMGIYSYELFHFYDVDRIIRIGSCGAYTKDLHLYDVLLATECYSNSNYGLYQNGDQNKSLSSSPSLNEQISLCAKKMNVPLHEGRIYSSDVFYGNQVDPDEMYHKNHCLAVEMESFALFHNAFVTGKEAACLLTVSDNMITKEETTSEEREKSFDTMILIALNSIL